MPNLQQVAMPSCKGKQRCLHLMPMSITLIITTMTPRIKHPSPKQHCPMTPRNQVGECAAREHVTFNPKISASARHRHSPYPIISLDHALKIIAQTVQPLPAITLPVGPELQGHVLAEDVFAPQDVPSSPTTSVDGYAMRCKSRTWHSDS